MNNTGRGEWSPNLVTGVAPATPPVPTISNATSTSFDASVDPIEHSDSYVWRIIGGNADRTPMRTDNDISYSMLSLRSEYTITVASSFLGTDSPPSDGAVFVPPFDQIGTPFVVSLSEDFGTGRLTMTLGVAAVPGATEYRWRLWHPDPDSATFRRMNNPSITPIRVGFFDYYVSSTNALTISFDRPATTDVNELPSVLVLPADSLGLGDVSPTILVSSDSFVNDLSSGRIGEYTWIDSQNLRDVGSIGGGQQ